MMRLSFVVAGAILLAQSYIPRERMVDMQHMRLQVRFAPEKGVVYGLVTHIFEPLRPGIDSLVLDAVQIEVEEARFRDQPIRFRNTGEQLILYFPSPLQVGKRDSLAIRYMATPRKGIYFIGWKDKTGRARKQIWTQGQGIDHRHWIPAYDDP
ncbi:MAG: hypothetical protein NZ933_06870, partial [Bacteroidia bacterium]|nr:hypothetical protein [Bacteroidia bacterium]